MEPTIVSGTGVICISHDRVRALMIESAMQQAILKAHDEGITDPDEIKKRIIEAKEAVR